MENAAYSEKDRIARQMEAIEGRFEELSIRITLPEVIADTALFQKLMREHSDMEELATAAKAYGKLRRHIEEAQEMADGDDPDMAEMAREELTELNAELDKATAEARLLLLPKDPDDRRNAIIEVRAGAGGDEAGLFGAELVRMYAHYAAARGWKTEMIEGGETELGGIKEAIMSVKGKNVFERLKLESGVHRVQRVPETETQGRIHTSTATVAVMPEAEEAERLIETLTRRQAAEAAHTSENPFLAAFGSFRGADVLTKEMAQALIERVYVDGDSNIEIVFRYRDEYKELCTYLEGRKTDA